MAIETRTPRYSPHSANRPAWTREPLSEKQAAWLGGIVDQTVADMRATYSLMRDAVMLAEGTHTPQARKDAARAITETEARNVAAVETLRETLRGEFDSAIAEAKDIRDAYARRVTRERANVAAILSRRAGRPVTGAVQGPSASVEDGATYRAPDGRVFHAYLGQSGRLLLKLWTAGGEDSDGEGGTFDYFGAASRLPSGSVRLTTEECQDFGRATGTCAICMRHLTDDESVARGIGPICWGKL